MFVSIVRAGALVAACAGAMPAAAQRYAGPPAPPMGAAPNLNIPAHDAQGSYDTPNRNLTPGEAAWHVRAALNVAALSCRDAEEVQTVAAYNRMLTGKRAVLAEADLATRATYKAKYGAGWQNRHDGTMTRVYNFFAQPNAQSDFCRVARTALREVEAVPPAVFTAWAQVTLVQLEAPFLDFYRAYDSYRMELADYRAGRGPRMASAMALTATAPVDRAVPIDDEWDTEEGD